MGQFSHPHPARAGAGQEVPGICILIQHPGWSLQEGETSGGFRGHWRKAGLIQPPQARDGPAGPSSASIILLPLLAARHLPLPPSPPAPADLPRSHQLHTQQQAFPGQCLHWLQDTGPTGAASSRHLPLQLSLPRLEILCSLHLGTHLKCHHL